MSSIHKSKFYNSVGVSLKVNFSLRINTRFPSQERLSEIVIWTTRERERDYRRLYALHISIAISVIAKSSSSCFEEVERGYFASGSNASWHEVKRISITIAITDLPSRVKRSDRNVTNGVLRNYQRSKRVSITCDLRKFSKLYFWAALALLSCTAKIN